MSNSWFQFKQFIIRQDQSAMKVTTDACLFGAWVAGQLQKNNIQNGNCLDIGTGTGLLTLMLAQQLPLQFDTIEKDPAAAIQAEANCQASSWSNSIRVITANALTHTFDSTYDSIICNPPFYEKELKSEDEQKNMAHHDAGLTLVELLRLIKKLLKPGGRYFLLLPYKRHEEIMALLADASLYMDNLCLVRQSVQHGYFRIMLTGTSEENKRELLYFDELAIKDAQEAYTPAFAALLRPYYLKL